MDNPFRAEGADEADCLCCRIFVLTERPSDLSESEYLEAQLVKISSILQTLIADYIFHFDEPRFHVTLSASSGTKASAVEYPPHLACTLRFGDCIDDEWFFVYLALELTKALPDVAITYVDGKY
jgi:hypothetical protein